MTVEIKRLPSGWVRISDPTNQNNWAQVPCWPCHYTELNKGIFIHATKEFWCYLNSELPDEFKEIRS